MSRLPAALKRLRALAGLATAVVPAAIVVHLVAEALAVGHAGVGLDFLLRHVYLGMLLVLSAGAFARTLGIGRGRAEIRRRTALLRAALLGPRAPVSVPILALANVAFFSLTQAGEGLPILSGSLWLGLVAGIVGSVVAAVLVAAFGRSLLVAAVEALAHVARRAAAAAPERRPHAPPVSRAAARTFSLFSPNRPPPARPWSDFSLHQKGTPCTHSFAQRGSPLRFSPASRFF